MKRALPVFLALLILGSMLPLAAMAEVVTTRYVKTSNYGSVNMRMDASKNSDIITKVPYGRKVKLYDYMIRSEWAYCSYNGYYGYIMVRYLSTSKPSPKPAPQPTAKPTAKPQPANLYKSFAPAYYNAVVNPSTPTGYVHMRWAPSKSEPIFRDYYAGQTLQVLYANSTWAQVYDPQNRVFGYMMTAFLSYHSAIQEGDGIVVGTAS